jgi:hypothetical protein
MQVNGTLSAKLFTLEGLRMAPQTMILDQRLRKQYPYEPSKIISGSEAVSPASLNLDFLEEDAPSSQEPTPVVPEPEAETDAAMDADPPVETTEGSGLPVGLGPVGIVLAALLLTLAAWLFLNRRRRDAASQ